MKNQLYAFGSASTQLHIPGMTLRDYFAAKAMQSILNVRLHSEELLVDLRMEAFSEEAYSIADAMLKARGQS